LNNENRVELLLHDTGIQFELGTRSPCVTFPTKQGVDVDQSKLTGKKKLDA
jgi:hypothetical protein